jgi:hypothetical protein
MTVLMGITNKKPGFQLRASPYPKTKETSPCPGNVPFAKQMLQEGEDMEKIIRYTGLSREKIEKLKQ